MRIGNVQLQNNLLLAPMAGITNKVFRTLCRGMGCGLAYTEMISAKGMYYGNHKTNTLVEIDENERPIAVQIFGSDPEVMAETAKKISASGACILDINMGCPVPKIVKNGEGSALMLKPELVAKIVKAVCASSSIPVTVKIRKGWDDNSINAPEIALIAEDNGASAVAVHGRTREQFYSGKADWDIIAEVKRKVKIPVIGNGDIFSPEDVKAIFERTGCDAVMIGRGALGNPWIFARTMYYLQSGELPDEPKIEQRKQMMLTHIKAVNANDGERCAVIEARKHIPWYVKGLKNACAIRQKVNMAVTPYEIYGIIENIQDNK